MPKLIALVGPSNSGKTTLLEKLIPALQARGLRVGVVKNDAHGFKIDKEGKDTDRLFKSGAAGVLIHSPEELAFRRVSDPTQPLQEIADHFFADCQLVLIEGGKHTPFAKIELWHSARHAAPLDPAPAGRVAFVSDVPVDAATAGDLPTFDWNDLDGIRDFVAGLV